MLWTPTTEYFLESFEKEVELETAIQEIKHVLFGPNRIYLDIKKKIGAKGKTNNIPDGYLIDLTSHKKPILYVVENELAKHDSLKHIAVQILEFSLSFESSPQKVKTILRDALEQDSLAKGKCTRYAQAYGFENVDYLLEQMVYKGDFSALVIIDELSDELETLLVQRFKFAADVITLRRYKNALNERIYDFEPFLIDITGLSSTIPDHVLDIHSARHGHTADEVTVSSVDFSDIDTIVVPAREDGFQEVALGENRWHHIRIHGTMIPKIKYIAFYQTAPISAITHVAPVKSIEPWDNTSKYVLDFSEPAHEITPLRMSPEGRIKHFKSPRYTSYEKLKMAQSLDDAF